MYEDVYFFTVILMNSNKPVNDILKLTTNSFCKLNNYYCNNLTDYEENLSKCSEYYYPVEIAYISRGWFVFVKKDAWNKGKCALMILLSARE